MKYDIDELRWVRIFSPVHIPKYLVEQVRDKEYSVENFFKFQEINCLEKDEDGIKLNPINHLYVLVDKENLVKGFLWAVVDMLTNDLIINTFSMDKNYWGQGKAVKKATDHIKEILKKLKLNKVFWLTNYPKHSERHGFKRSKSILMEYSEEEDGKDTIREHKIQGKQESSNSTTAAAPPASSGKPRAASLREPRVDARASKHGGSAKPVPADVC